jgi:hypothetical protein
MNKASTIKRQKKDVLVSVRLPKSLVEELKDIQKINHFIDLSDEIRFVVRKYCLNVLNITNSISSKPPVELLLEERRKEKLISDLTNIIDNLKNTKQDVSLTTKSLGLNAGANEHK